MGLTQLRPRGGLLEPLGQTSRAVGSSGTLSLICRAGAVSNGAVRVFSPFNREEQPSTGPLRKLGARGANGGASSRNRSARWRLPRPQS